MYDKIIEAGILGLLIYTPLAFGGVTPRSIMLLEMISGGLFIVWLVKIFSQRKKQPSSNASLSAFGSTTSTTKNLLIGIVVLFLTLILFQYLPLPSGFVELISPAASSLYAEGASLTQTALPAWLPLSVYSQATETEFYKLLAYALVFFLIITTFRTRKQVSRLVYTLFIIGCFEALYGFLQFLSGTKLIDFYPSSASWVNGTFVNKNHFAGYLEMVIPITLGILLTQFEDSHSSRMKVSVEHFRETYPKAFLLLLAAFFMISSLLLSGSRGGIISFACAIIFFLLLAYNRRLLRTWTMILLIFVPLAIGVTIIVNPAVLSQRLYTLKELETDLSFRVRWELWQNAIHMFQDYPIAGSGAGTFTHLQQRYQTFRGQGRHFFYTHNDYVQLFAETGIVGVSLMALIGVSWLYHIFSLWRRRHSRWAVALGAGGLSAMFSLLIHSATDFNFHIPSNAMLFVVIAAINYVIVNIPGSEGRTRKAGGRGQKAEGRREKTVAPPYAAEEISPVVVKKDKKQSMLLWLLIPACLLTLFYLFRVGMSYSAWTYYQDGVNEATGENSSVEKTSQYALGVDALDKAVRYDRNNAEYFFTLGKLLSQYFSMKGQQLDEAELWMQKAVMLDPANPWYYYDLGRLSHKRRDCPDKQTVLQEEDRCVTSRYFEAVLKNAPKDMFLRKAVGRWFYHYEREYGNRLMRELVAGDTSDMPESPSISREFSRFLYEIGLDYESDLEVSRHLFAEQGAQETCQSHIVYSYAPDSREDEFGTDDGSAEWKTRLILETERVKKILCLPENLDEYQHAALKIFMNNGGMPNFVVQIWLDDHLIKTFEHTIPRVAKWYDIPFDKALLQGKSKIHVYIRVSQASEAGNYLQIWGDQDNHAGHSTFNVEMLDDLSSSEGNQRGEYLIRLVLRK